MPRHRCGQTVSSDSRGFCTQCGASRAEGIAFCSACGASFGPTPSDPNATISNSAGGDLVHPRKNDRHRKALIALAVIALAVVGGAVALVSGNSSEPSTESEESTPTSAVTESDVESTSVAMTTTMPPPETTDPIPAPGASLGYHSTLCEGSELAYDPASDAIVLRNAPEQNAYVIDRWVAGRFDVLYIACNESYLLVTALTDNESVEIRDSDSDLLENLTRFTPRLLRLEQSGRDEICCYPEVPLERADLVTVERNGTFTRVTSEVARFDQWNPGERDCDRYTQPDRYAAATPSGEVVYSGEYVTVCSEGPLVELLQTFLVNQGFDIIPDGYFGPATLAALNGQARADGFDRVDGAFMAYSTEGSISYGVGIQN